MRCFVSHPGTSTIAPRTSPFSRLVTSVMNWPFISMRACRIVVLASVAFSLDCEAIEELAARVVRLRVEVELVLPHEARLAVAGRGDHRVEQLRRRQALHVHPREAARVGLARVRHLARQLVGLRADDAAHQHAVVELGVGERPAEFFEQLGVGRLVVLAGLVDRVEDAVAEEVRPHPVRHVLGEERVLGAGEPVREFLSRAAVLAPSSGSVPSKNRATTVLSVFGIAMRFLSDCGCIGPTKPGRFAGSGFHLGEERRELPELFARVRRERVVVALGAFELHAEEQPADGRAHVLGLRARWPDRSR